MNINNPLAHDIIYLTFSAWASVRDPPFDSELKSTKSFMLYFVGYMFLGLDRTLIQCHARQNLLFFSETNCCYEGHTDFFLGTKISFIISGAILFLTLNISVAMACIFLWWIEPLLSFLNRSWKKDDLTPLLKFLL